MKEKLGNILLFVLFFTGLLGGGFSVYRFLDFIHCPEIISDVVGLAYVCAYGLIFGKTSLGGKTAEERAYDEGFADGQVEQEERNLLSVAGASQSQYKRGYDEGFAAGTKDAQARVDQVYVELLRMQKNPYTGIPITTQAQYYQYLEQKKAAAAARQTQSTLTEEDHTAE